MVLYGEPEAEIIQEQDEVAEYLIETWTTTERIDGCVWSFNLHTQTIILIKHITNISVLISLFDYLGALGLLALLRLTVHLRS